MLSAQPALTKAALDTLLRTAQAFSKVHFNPVTIKAGVATLEASDADLATAAASGIDVLMYCWIRAWLRLLIFMCRIDLANRQSPIASVHASRNSIMSNSLYAYAISLKLLLHTF